MQFALCSFFRIAPLNKECIAHLGQKCHNSKFGIFELSVQKETFADALVTGILSQRSLQNSPLESSCVVVALIENSKPLNISH
jgi:hypothetical protein